VKSARHIAIVLVSAPDLGIGRKIAKALLKSRLAACVNIVPRIESHYRWKGKTEIGAEVLLIIKSTNPKLAVLESTVIKNHPYDTPEVISFSLNSSNGKYLKWLVESVR